MKKRTIVLFGLLLMVMTAVAGGKIKVACVGNSVTWGMTITDREKNCYPAQLQKMLGDKYEVRNSDTLELHYYNMDIVPMLTNKNTKKL